MRFGVGVALGCGGRAGSGGVSGGGGGGWLAGADADTDAGAMPSRATRRALQKVTPNMLLNRMLGLEVHQQALVFAHFAEVLEVLVTQAKLEGRFSEGVVDIVGQEINITKGSVVLLGTAYFGVVDRRCARECGGKEHTTGALTPPPTARARAWCWWASSLCQAGPVVTTDFALHD